MLQEQTGELCVVLYVARESPATVTPFRKFERKRVEAKMVNSDWLNANVGEGTIVPIEPWGWRYRGYAARVL
jgi:hypothetical protein